MIEASQGWGWPGASRKAHYFLADSRSLCFRWAYVGRLEDAHHDSPDNCAECRRKRAALLVKADKAAGRDI